ncbi:MAG TPA: hypothetical protein VFL95_04425 [Gemmatimonadales bacterium]|nr:hypothetical protein [Gemmatimonadales bacterium]
MSRAAAARQLLASRFPDALPQAQQSWSAVPTGVAELDRLFPAGGFPRGRLATWTPGLGAAALLRVAAVQAVRSGERSVWVDADRSVIGDGWPAGPLLLRPPDRAGALRATAELARSGGFALIVLDGATAEQTDLVRLSRAAHEGGTALVLLNRATALSALRVHSRPVLSDYAWRPSRVGDAADLETVRVRVEARASGWLAHTVLSLPLWHDDLRLSLDPALPDRRGAGR